jgi:hypothetical protein
VGAVVMIARLWLFLHMGWYLVADVRLPKK